MAAICFVACNPPNIAGPALKPTSTKDAFKGQVQCSAIRPKTEPDLMAWDPGERANLNEIRQQGLVVVRYKAKGCDVELQVLSNCIASGSYKYYPYNSSNSIVVNNMNELYGKLPLGASRFASKLHGDRGLRTDYELVGIDAMPAGTAVRRSDLHGDCQGATHVISKIYVGGFALDAGEQRSLDAAATIFGAGAGAKSVAGAQHLQSEGSPAACKQAMNDGTPQFACSTPLRIALLPLGPAPAHVAAVKPAAHPGKMVRIPAGTFMMGSPAGVGNNDEHPQHRVLVNAFYMDLTEVTVAQYAACVAAGNCHEAGTGGSCNSDRADRANHPENCVDWNMARDYCRWIGGRLPTEEEWEYAARGTDGRTYPWGNEAPGPSRVNACGSACAVPVGLQPLYNSSDGWGETAPVASYPAGRSPFGLYDMAGNVQEWTSSRDCLYSSSRNCNGNYRVVRGGSWSVVGASRLRVAARSAYGPSARVSNLGFRCAR